ncbi:MAG: glutathione S-transferase, partial [Deltaproteobacteria bacterium]
AINPRGEVPALELDDGMVITESVAICLYLEESEPGPRLFGLTPEEKATVLMWDRRIEWDGLHAVAEMLRNGNPAFADRALPGPIDYEQIPQLVERGRRRLGYFFDTLDERLAHNTYVAGEFFSVADITALVTIDFARVVDMRIPAEKTHLKRWYDAVSARPSAKA